MPKEIERRFILTQLPSVFELHHPWRIHQAYTVVDEAAGREERVRFYQSPDGDVSYQRYVKIGGGRDREETATPISVAEFNQALLRCLGRPIIKDIYYEQYAGRWIEFHIFLSHRPLMTIELEFGEPTAAEKFQAPVWFGREVTEDHRYNSAGVALNGVPNDFEPSETLIKRFATDHRQISRP